MHRLPKPSVPANIPLPIAVFGVVCLLALSLPNGGSANSYSDAIVFPASVNTTMQSTAMQIEELHEVDDDTFVVRPKTLARNVSHLRLLRRQAHLPNFTTNHNELAELLNDAAADPRLQRKGRTWQLSTSFTSQVGADPWALKGVGFPNIETHDEKVSSNYKPYQPLVDWTLAEANEGEWEPIPAVHCMGLSAQQIADRAKRHEREILSYSIKYKVSASLVKAVITKESCFNTKAVSKVGAEGLMQLMPDTARWLKVTDRSDVNQNLAAGIRYLSDLRKRFGTEELALAAYNAGPGNVERYGGIPPFEETQQYVKSVMTFYKRYVAATRFANQRVSN